MYETPDRLPKPVPTSSMDAVISQNEDLMARLKVTLKRLALLEQEHQESQTDLTTHHQWVRQLQDQLEVWQEKEKLWNLKKVQLESEAQNSQENAQAVQALMKEASRYRRFHFYFKKNIKPAFLELKSFCNRLGQELRLVQGELEKKSDQCEKTHQQNLLLQEKLHALQFETQQELQKRQEQHLQERTNQEREILSLRISNEQLAHENKRVPNLLNTQDDLQNQIIALRRERDLLLQNQMTLAQNKETEIQALKVDSQRKVVLIDDLKLKLAHSESHGRSVENQMKDLHNQMETLRALWTQKSEECEKMRIALRNLEKLNSNLSLELNKQTNLNQGLGNRLEPAAP